MSVQSSVPLKFTLAVNALNRGGIIAYPTEGTWGLGCDPNNHSALLRLLALKGRSADKGFILIAASLHQLLPYLKGVESPFLSKFEQVSAKPVTWLVPDNGVADKLIKGNFTSVALRVSAHPIVRQLCLQFGGPIVSTSANYSGRPSANWSWQVHKQLGYGLDYLLHGTLGDSMRPSEIRDLITDKILRQG